MELPAASLDELLRLEHDGWEALSSPGDAGRQFYAAVLRDDAVMLFPGGIEIAGRERILQSLAAAPWESFRIEDARAIVLTPNAATLVYRVRAERHAQAAYAALISSTYVHEREWKLVIHQQTPL